MKEIFRRYTLLVILSILLSSCSGAAQEAPAEPFLSLEQVIPMVIEPAELFDNLLIDEEISNQILEETNKPPGPIADGYLRAWKMIDEDSLIYAMVLEFIYEADARMAFEEFEEGLKNNTEELGIGDESVISYSDFNLAVAAVRNGYFFILTGSAILTEDAPVPDLAIVPGLVKLCNDNLKNHPAGSMTAERPLAKPTRNISNYSDLKANAPARYVSQHALLSQLMPQKAETFTIQLNREGKNNGQMTVGIITKNLGKVESGKCKYEIEAYLRDILVKDDGDDFTRGNGDVITYFKFTTICGVLEYRTTDIAPEDGVKSGKKLDFTVNNTSDGRLITSFTCEADCKSQCAYSVFGYARDIDTSDALDVTAAILTLGIRLTNKPGKDAIIKDINKLNSLRKALGLPEISSWAGSNILGETRKIYGDALGEGNSGEKKVDMPPTPSAEAEPEAPQETVAVDCSLYGIVPGDPEILQDDLNQLADAISESYGCPVTLEAIPSGQDFMGMLENERVEFAWIESYDYLNYPGITTLTPIGIPFNEFQGAFVQSMIVTQAGLGFENLADLEGVDFAFTAPGSFVGVALPRMMLLSEGYDPDSFFNHTIPIGNDPLLMFSALLDGSVDAVVTWRTDLRDARENVVDSLPDVWDSTTVVATSPWFPTAVIMSTADEAVTEALKIAFIELSGSDVLYGLYETTDMIEVEQTDYYESFEWLEYWWIELDYDLGGWPD